MNNRLPEEMNCSGCGACANVCPVNAIEMKYSENQFIIPVTDEKKCIDCNLCHKTCPSLNPVFKNNEKPAIYSFCADDSIRSISSSGGMFSLLAYYVLEKGGYVCGAAFDDEFQLRHRIISKKEELLPLCSSKYVHSDTDNCYNEIKKLLTNDNYVLFVGTPCQVAGLYGVLNNKDYEKLITADVICHGAPSQRFLDNYLKEISGGRKVKNVYFRNKKFGWTCSVMNIVFEDGTEYVGRINTDNKDPYFEAFIKNMMMRRMCYNCKYSTYPRQGDFTLGDLWHSDKLDPKSDDKKGTSMVFANNSKAEKIFSEISEKAKYYNKLTVQDYAKIPNRVYSKTKINPYRRRFLNLMKKKSFTEAFNLAYNKRYDIGLVSVIGNENIGSILTYYALYNTLSEMNYSVLMIERPTDSTLKVSEKAKAFTDKWLPEYARPVQYENILSMRQLNSKCEQFVVGSDQIYLSKMSANRNNCYFLQWVDKNKNKVGYSCSFGGPGARGTKEYYKTLSYYLNQFSFLSSRENDGVNLINNEMKLDKKAVWCIDPVFLCSKNNYLKLIKSAGVKRENPFIGAYVIIPRPSISNLLKRTKAHFKDINLELIGDEAKIKQSKELSKYNYSDAFPIEKSLEKIYSSKFFITDSFHGVCFAIIFKKDFLVIPRDFMDRFTSLLDRIGLSDRIISPNLSNLTAESFSPINYDEVYKKLNTEIENSRNLLQNALKNTSQDKIYDFDVIMKYIAAQNDEIQKLKEAIKNNNASASESSGIIENNISELISKMSADEKNKRILQLEKENAELKHINSILKSQKM